MSARIEEMQRQIELMLNQVIADQTVERVVIQGLLHSLFGERQDALRGLRAGVLEGLSKMTLNPEDMQGSERSKQLTIMRAEMFFQDIDRGIAVSGNAPLSEKH